jgi:predicted nucleic acid-binding protein
VNDEAYLIDSNVVLDVLTEDSEWFDWSAETLANAARSGPTYINPIVFSEVAVGFDDLAELETRMPSAILRRARLPFAAAFLAAKVHQAYRRRGGTRIATLPDFYIGAHAVVEGLTLVTRDPRRYRSTYPGIRLITPR